MESFDVLPCGYLSFRDDGTITECNTTLTSWLGSSPEEIVGKKFETILTLPSKIFYNTHFFPLIKLNSKAHEIFLFLKGTHDAGIPVLVNAGRASSNAPIRCVFLRVDERKKYEQELLEARRKAEAALHENEKLAELSQSLEHQALKLDKQYQHQKMMNENLLQFSKIISHDLQEPIRKIRIFLDKISHDTETVLSPRSTSYASKVDEASVRLKALTISLEEYISIDNEKIYKPIDLNATIEAATSRAKKNRQFSDFDIYADKIPAIEGYQDQLELLFFQLIDNAIQFRSPARRLSIKVTHTTLEENIFRMDKDRYKYEEHVRISFEDNGIGFVDEYKDNIFQLFKKLDASTSGLGVGLSLVKKIVLNHSGDVKVTSRPDKGTIFQIELPLKMNHGGHLNPGINSLL